MLLIDSSAIVKFLSKEPGWEGTIEYVSAALTIPLATIELGSALLKKVRKKELSAATANTLLRGYSESAILLDQNKHVITAFQIAVDTNLAIYDSLFVATALNEGHDLVSSDAKQIKVARSLGVKVIEC